MNLILHMKLLQIPNFAMELVKQASNAFEQVWEPKKQTINGTSTYHVQSSSGKESR